MTEPAIVKETGQGPTSFPNNAVIPSKWYVTALHLWSNVAHPSLGKEFLWSLENMKIAVLGVCGDAN